MKRIYDAGPSVSPEVERIAERLMGKRPLKGAVRKKPTLAHVPGLKASPHYDMNDAPAGSGKKAKRSR